MKRTPRPLEIRSFSNKDGSKCYSISKRRDGFYEIYVDRLIFDPDEEVGYWSTSLPKPSVFGNVEDAENELFAQFGDDIISN
jgi:hypothetical protein